MSSSNGKETNSQLSNKEVAEFEEMLPWLINGTLAEAEREALECALTKSKKLRNEKVFLTKLQQQIKQQERPDVPVEFAWQKMKRQIADEKKQQVISTGNSQRENRWRYIAMAASILLVIQSSSLLVSWNQDGPYTPLSSHSSGAKTNAAQFTVQFVETATALDIQQLLREYQLSVISGPSSIGLYRVSGPTDSLKNAYDILSQIKSRNDIIAHVQQDE